MKPLIVGPWLGEVGFELLYWIPFLRRSLQNMPKREVYILSRGGCRSWYADLSCNYLELYDWYSPDTLARLNAKRVTEQRMSAASLGLRRNLRSAKQLFLSTVERDLIDVASRKTGIGDADILHPSQMYETFRPYWKRERPDLIGQWTRACSAKRITPPSVLPSLPSPYVAVKFYASQANPDGLEASVSVAELVHAIADDVNVVLLHTGTRYDEHGEFAIPKHPGVQRFHFEPGQNLDQQTAIIAGSKGYVGTYGGFAYIAPFLGVPTLALYGVKNFRRDHLKLMTHVARQLQAPFDVTHLEKGRALARSVGRVAYAA